MVLLRCREMKDVGHQLGERKEKHEDGDIVCLKVMAECVSDGGAAWEGQEGQRKHGVRLLNDKIGIHLKALWMPTEEKRPAREAKSVMESLRQEKSHSTK